MSETATEQAIKRDERESATRGVELAMLAFQQAWSPKDKYDAHQFSTDLFMLVRRIYLDAQQPGFDFMHKLYGMQPFPPYVIKDKTP